MTSGLDGKDTQITVLDTLQKLATQFRHLRSLLYLAFNL